MDVSTITDVDKLKSMAYDELALKERCENNLRVINQRIVEVSQANVNAAIAKKKAEVDAAAGNPDPAAASEEQPENSSDSTGEPDNANS